ncbi:class I SAM-dependent methyltransferase [Chamaesiphon polymorphus]|uniref:SAM-dependent methyltransferase n=1 Tax=Chamaesiphon polymorphus CCALA 037 TaxID=2107692 RepID=A0A2T1GC54_9CYAN|nr:class I SAM-dependent methyltransferase [Chamaesiphon polymorphus]PSB54952.1 SAM-dependent methyltransferase [Chamaesiphon polymorphus CCALA 037]
MYSSLISPQQDWTSQIDRVKQRFDREYKQEAFELPAEVEAMPIFREWIGHNLAAKTTSPFWELAAFQKNHRCLDIGCGVSFLIYNWREWETYFYGQEVSTVARSALNSRGSQLNSKLFKGVQAGAAHQLQYENDTFDRAIATGFSCYYPLEYWKLVLQEVKRVLKPNGIFVFDAIDPTTEIAENWAILETYLGAEVFLSPLAEFNDLVKEVGGKVTATKSGQLFQMYRISF